MKRNIISAILLAFIAMTINASANNRYNLDADNSIINWEGKKVLGKHHGVIKFKSGWLDISNNQIKGGEFIVDMNSIENHDLKDNKSMQEKLVNHLRSDDFFNVEKHPVSKFKVKKSEKIKEYGGSVKYKVTGDLTIRGKSYSYSFPVTLTKSNDKLYASALITFDRSNHDIKFNSGSFFENLGDKMIYDEIPLDMSIVFVQDGASK